MNAGEGLRMGLIEIRAHAMRSFLSFLGILVGVASVMVTLAVLGGFERRMKEVIELTGPGRLSIHPDRNYKPARRLSKGLTLEDARALRRLVPELAYVDPRSEDWGVRVSLDAFRENAYVAGVTPEMRRHDWVYTVRGRFFSEEDLARSARVCALVQPGPKDDAWSKYFSWWKDPFDKVFEKADPLGRMLRLGGGYYRVVAVLQEPPRDKDPRWFRGNQPKVLIPLTTFLRYYRGDTKLTKIETDAGAASKVPRAEARLRAALKILHRGEEDVTFEKMGEFMAERIRESRRAQAVFLIVGIIALLAGGIGIMNVTLATVYSRVREIGIRRAVGATRLDILIQFMLESVLLAVLGGAAGVAVGGIGAALLPRLSEDIEVVVRPSVVGLCLAASAVVGLVFSVYPAYQASRMDPVESMRYE